MTQATDIIYISHGGGPLPLLNGPDHKEMVETLQVIVKNIVKPSAIVVVSAHWEMAIATITSGGNPHLIYDYSGFPQEAYDIQYSCPGSPALADELHRTLLANGEVAAKNDQRGFDHGLFVPLKIMYPDADIPCVQLSLLHSLDAKAHLTMGRALQSLNWENVLVIGSGFSFHNMREFFSASDSEAHQKNAVFQDWLENTVTNRDISEAERLERLARWEQAPHARFCHPREEHLLPLHVCYGMAGRAADACYSATILNKQSTMFHWRR